MGTNYFWHYGACGHCGRNEVAHVCKSLFIWRGYPSRLLSNEHPEWGHTEVSPFGFPVLSLADWRRVFTDHPGELWDEYANRVEEPPLEFLSLAVPWKPDPDDGRRWLDEDIARGDGWLDPQGYRFSAREFS